jgi:hypothetical protein
MGWQLTDPLAQISATCPGDPCHGVMPNAPVLVREQSSTEWFASVLTVIPNGPCLALGDSEAWEMRGSMTLNGTECSVQRCWGPLNYL